MADRQYELVYILPPDATEAQVAEVQTQIEEVVFELLSWAEGYFCMARSPAPTTGGASVSPMKSPATRRATTSSRRSTAAAS